MLSLLRAALGLSRLFAVLAFLLLTSAPGARGQAKGLPPGPDVRVINSASEPVPVTGQVEVSELPAVQLDTTEPLPVTDVDNPARQPFQTFLSPSGPTQFDVPAGKRLVIEHVSGNAYSTGTVHWIQIQTTVGGAYTAHLFPVTRAGLAGNGVDSVFVFANETRLYADPGTSVFVTYSVVPSSSDVARYVAFSGYLVDVP